jgi:hypothetical protein
MPYDNQLPVTQVFLSSQKYTRQFALVLLAITPFFRGHLPLPTGPDAPNNLPALGNALPEAYAHNDYLHEKPLLEALSNGFTSVEADVHLVNGELYLGHWLPKISENNTLRAAYLTPLNKLMAAQDGEVYPNYEGVFHLMVDIKTDAKSTYEVLRCQLLQYKAFLRNPHIRVFISGNRATETILADSMQVISLDGRLSDINGCFTADQMPVISDNFKKHFQWRGRGTMPASEKKRIQLLAEQAHRQGKKLRFWAIPDNPNGWEVLLEAGVDLINTDNLTGFRKFLTTKRAVSF